MYTRILYIALALLLLSAPAAIGQDFGSDLLKGAGRAFGPGPGGTVFRAASTMASPGASEDEEIAVGRQIAGNLLGAAPLVKDKKLQSYVNLVGRWVALQSERPDLNWHFGVIDSGDINAFAAPGGYIFVTKGLYMMLDSEAQLAGVLAHEIAHVVRRHHYKVIRQQKAIDFGGRLLSEKAGGDNPLVQRLIGSGAEVVARGLDKSAEYEADRMGVVLAARAGYDQYALIEVLQEMGHYAGDDDSVRLLFKTHPHPDVRLNHLDQSMGDRLDNLKGQTVAKRFYRLKK